MSEPLANTLSTPFARASQIIGEYLPNVLAGIAIALLGWLAAFLLAKVARYLTARAQAHLDRIKWFQTRTQQVRAYRAAPVLIGRLIFWTVLIFFLVAAVEALGLSAVSTLLAKVTTYLPRIVAAIVIVFAGLFAGDIASGLVSRGLTQMGITYGDTLARVAHALIVIVAVIIGIEQLGVDSTVLTLVLSITFGTTLGAVALAFGLGARSTVSNMLAVQQISKSYHVGDTVRIGDVEGPVVEITQTAVVVEAPAGKIMIPGHRFSDEVSAQVTQGG